MNKALVAGLSYAVAALFAGAAVAQAPAAAPSDGQTLFNNQCRTCHTTKDGDNRLGPNLQGIVGRKSGQVEGYAYSESMKNAGLVWDEGTLDKFIENPDAVVSGHNMKPYAGIKEPEVRKAIVAFLKDGSGK